MRKERFYCCRLANCTWHTKYYEQRPQQASTEDFNVEYKVPGWSYDQAISSSRPSGATLQTYNISRIPGRACTLQLSTTVLPVRQLISSYVVTFQQRRQVLVRCRCRMLGSSQVGRTARLSNQGTEQWE
jgi:hypothetical protein